MKPDTLLVKAAHAGRPVFMPHNVRVFVDGIDKYQIRQDPVVVPNTRFYRQRVRKGDLVLVEAVVETERMYVKRARKEK